MGQARAIGYIDGPRFLQALTAGIHHLSRSREHLNAINVFPVPDGDTGTNMVFTFRYVLDAVSASPPAELDQLLALVADTALDGARGNSGAIMAQYIQGMREYAKGMRLMSARRLAGAAQAGSAAAWKAMSKPVEGTLPTVLQAFTDELLLLSSGGEKDIRVMLERGLKRSRKALADTPRQLAVLRQAGVVDAGGQGFVDLLEGIWAFVDRGVVDQPLSEGVALDPEESAALQAAAHSEFNVGDHRYCTECVIEGDRLDRDAVMQKLESLDTSSLVVAGSMNRIKVHAHVDNPAELYLACEQFGEIRQQKADDMARQHHLLSHTGSVVIVTDSGADIPESEVDRLGIQVVPVRLSFGDREFLDGISLDAGTFYQKLAEASETPLTSQPPAQDFARIYSLFTSHGYSVISVGLSEQLSGTTTAARQAASRFGEGEVTIVDSLSATCGQGLLAILGAEAALRGMDADEVEAFLQEMIPLTQVFGICDDLSFAVRGGRVPAWVKHLVNLLRVNPVLTAKANGKLGLDGFLAGTRVNTDAIARHVTRKMKKDDMVRVLISHANCRDAAVALRKGILERHDKVHSCHITEAGPALGVHFGPGALLVGFAPQPDLLD
jgi:DegV family protein with EDD domain